VEPTITTEEKEFPATLADGTQVTVTGKVIITDHHELDGDGNPKISVEVKVPTADLLGEPGQNG